MTRKDYILIASAVRLARDLGRDTVIDHDTSCDWISRSLAHRLVEDSPAFDAAKFLAACGVQDNDCMPR